MYASTMEVEKTKTSLEEPLQKTINGYTKTDARKGHVEEKVPMERLVT